MDARPKELSLICAAIPAISVLDGLIKEAILKEKWQRDIN